MAQTDWTAAIWRKSRYSGESGSCLEWAARDDRIGIRHSRRPDGPVVVVDACAWRGFVRAVVAGSLGAAPVDM